MQVSHLKTLTMADSSDTTLVRPSDWNSNHIVNMFLSGNTQGSSMVMGGNSGVILNGGANITLSADTLNSQVIISGPAGGGAGTGTTFSGTNISGSMTLNAAGLNLALSGAAAVGGNINLSAGSTSTNAAAFTFANSNGVSFGLGTGASAGQVTATVATNYQSQGPYLTTAAQSTQTLAIGVSNAGNTAGNTGTIINSNYVLAGSGLITMSQSSAAGQVTAWIQHPAWLTTADLSQNSSKYAGINGAITGGSITVNTSGVSVNLPAYLTTAMQSGASTQFVQANAGFNGTNASGTIASNSISISVAAQSFDTIGLYALGNTTQSTSNTADVRSLSFRGLGIASVGMSGGTIAISVPSGGGAAGVNIADSANTITSGTVQFSNSNGVSFGLNGSTMTASVAAGAGAATLSRWIPYEVSGVSTNGQSVGASFLNIMPFVLPANLTFNQINLIGSAAPLTRTAGNTIQMSASNGSTMGLTYQATGGNSLSFNVILFSRGSGVFSTNLMSFASTGALFATNATMTYQVSVTGGLTASYTFLSSYASSLTFPGLSSSTATSINAASSYTAWQLSAMTISGSTTASTANTGATVATFSSSLVGTFPSTTMFSSYQMLPIPFATSLSQGEYWIGLNWYQSVSNGSGTTGGNLAAGNSMTITIQGSNLQQNASMSTLGGQYTIAGSLGWFGSGTASTLGLMPGHGTLNQTYNPGSTFVNNMGQANGAIAFSQIATSSSFWRPFVEFATLRV